MNATTPTARQPGCPVLIPIGRDGTFGFCPAHERHVYLEAADRCLCDHCTPGPDDSHVVSPDVYFVGNDIVALKSDRAKWLAAEHARAATMQCAPKTARKPEAEARPATKPAPRPAPKRKEGLLAFT